jgi:methionyl-tRNA formyltransferase
MEANHRLKTVFMGTPELALPVLSALLDGGMEVVGVYTRPDKPAARGRRLSASPVKRMAQEVGVPLFQPPSLRPDGVQEELATLSPDVVVVAAYGLFLPARTLDLPPLGCLNVHPSLLPRHRGPSPVSRAILDGDAVTGVTIIRLDEGMDTGPIVGSRETAIGPGENAQELTARLFEMGAELLVEILPLWASGEKKARPQDDSQATVTGRLSKEDGEIDWRLDTDRIARQVRAYYPWPGTFTRWEGRLVKITEASPAVSEVAADPSPGRVVSLPGGGLGITTGSGVLEAHRVQLEGRKTAGAREFLRGFPDFVGAVLG